MSKILVTGGLGFVGSHLTKKLVARGDEVTVFDNAFRGNRGRIAEIAKHVKVIEGDIRNRKQVEKALHKQEIVYHLAAINGTKYFYEIPEEVLEVNVKGFLNVFDSAVAAGTKRFIFSSSSEVYQEAPVIPSPETVPAVIPDLKNRRFSYAGSKLIGELYCLHVAPKTSMETVIIRYHNVYGPAMGKEHVIPELFFKIEEASDGFTKDQVTISIQGDGRETRAFCYVDDAVEGTVIASDKGVSGEIYHVGTSEETPIKELIVLMARSLKVEINTVPAERRPGSVRRRAPDISKIQRLGYNPRYPLAQGLEETLKWYKANFQRKNV